MRRMLVVLAAGLAVLGSAVPPASAAVVRAHCHADTFAQETVTGGSATYWGVAYGYVLFDDLTTHSLRCYISVDYSEQGSTPTQSGTGVLTAAGSVAYTAEPSAGVSACVEIDGVTVGCDPVLASGGGGDPTSCSSGGVCASYTAGTPYQTFTVQGPAFTSVDVAAHVDLYEFTLPNGGTAALPCVIVKAGSLANPCALAGGRFLSRIGTLMDANPPVPTTTPGPPLLTVDVCNANLVLTVLGVGLTSFPAYALC